ncbi:MAG: hypothetical protein RL017_625 [Pseudomonadota bacterium]
MNTETDVIGAMHYILEKNNFPTSSSDEYNYYFKFGLTRLVAQTLPQAMQNNKSIAYYQQQLIDEISRNINLQARPYSGILELLDNLAAQNIPMAILSNNNHEYMAQMVDTYFSKNKFVAAFGTNANYPSKPNPQVALIIAKQMQLLPQEIILLGDSPADMQTAHNANMLAIGAGWGFCDKNDLLNSGATKVIKHPKEVLNLFN